MLSRFFGKSNPPTDAAEKVEKPATSGLEVKEDDAASAWSMWDEALASQSKLPTSLPASPPARTAEPATRPSAPASAVGFSRQSGPDVADDEVQTAAMNLEEKTPEQRKNDALAVVDQHHSRIGNTIRTMWGYPECSTYINKLIMAGGDGMGHARVGFNQDAVQAMLELADLHDAEFGAPPTGLMTLG